MLKLALLFVIFFLRLCTFGQNSIQEKDKEWNDKVKGKLNKIKVGKRSNGFAIFYFKSNKSIFAVEQREVYKTGNRIDSSISFSANFFDDTLFRVVIIKSIPSEKRGKIIMYLNKDQVIDKNIEGEIHIPEISRIIETAHQLFLKGKELIEKK